MSLVISPKGRDKFAVLELKVLIQPGLIAKKGLFHPSGYDAFLRSFSGVQPEFSGSKQMTANVHIGKDAGLSG
jgi:hypothetical protein